MRKKALRILTVFTVCIVILVSLTGCSFLGLHIERKSNSPLSGILQQLFPKSDPQNNPQPSSSTSDLTYEHYDPDEFYKNCEEMLRLYRDGDTEKAFSIYGKLIDELTEVDELSCIAYVKYSENVNDEYYTEEQSYMEETETSMGNTFFTACHEMITGPSADAFEKAVDNERYTSYYQDYVPLTDEQLELRSRELELVQQYYSQADTLMDTTCTIDGKTYTFSDILENDYSFILYGQDLYLEIYEQCLKKYNTLVGETFLELRDLRTQIAKSHGYDNYADYADAEIYYRDYTTSDLQVMKDAVKHFSPELQQMQYVFSTDASVRFNGTDDLFSRVGGILCSISPLAEEAFDAFTSNHLYSFGNEDGRMEGAYTLTLIKRNLPFIYAQTDLSSDSAITLAHEFGHFTAFYSVPMAAPLIAELNLDVGEIHSQGLELLFTANADELYGKEADNVRAGNVTRTAGAIIDGCVMDDWEREVYANPDMTLDEINECFRQIELEYGAEDYPGLEYLWCDIHHLFESPLYYISYAVSAFGALQIWAVSQEDYNQAVTLWENIVRQGAFDVDYVDALNDAGLDIFYEENVAYDLLDDVTYYLVQKYYTAY